MALPTDERGHIIITRNRRYSLTLEGAEGRWWVHIEVHQWSRETMREIQRAEEVLLGIFGELWALRRDEKQERFIRMFGWTPQGEETDETGQLTQTFKKEKLTDEPQQ